MSFGQGREEGQVEAERQHQEQYPSASAESERRGEIQIDPENAQTRNHRYFIEPDAGR
jgi:hypothetical protein